MNNPLVKINTDSPEEIAKLYDIGPRLARRIVKHRETHGYYHGPEDLAQVEGVSFNLATTLTPHIDWSAPSEPELPRRRSGITFLLSTVLLFGAIGFGRLSAVYLLVAWRNCYERDPLCLVEAWEALSGLVVAISLLARSLALTAHTLTRDPIKARLLRRISIFSVVFIVLAGISGLLSRACHYFYSVGNWTGFLSDYPIVLAIALNLSTFLVFGPLVLVIQQPTRAYNACLARIHDTGLMIVAPITAWAVWSGREKLPLWALVMMGLVGLLSALFGLSTLRTKESLFQKSCKTFLSPRTLALARDRGITWLAWINARLPDPEEQKALKQALDKTYPPSKWRTSAAVVLIASSWLVVTAIAAVVEWIVQGWLSQRFP